MRGSITVLCSALLLGGAAAASASDATVKASATWGIRQLNGKIHATRQSNPSAALAASFAIATAATAQPRAVKLEVKTPKTGGAGTFTTSGAGLCRRGATHDKIFTLPGAGNHGTLHFRKTFRCSNHAGTFVVEVRGHVTGARASGGWKIVTGTGAYAKLEGSGSFAAHGTATGFLDHYRGTISM